MNVPVYQLLGGPYDQRGIRGYYHVEHIRTAEDLAQLRETALHDGVSCLKIGLPDHDYEWIETNAKIDRAVKHMQRVREGLGDSIDIAVDFHAKMGPAVASIMIKEVEPLHLLFVEEPCPPENPQAMARIARHSTTPIATGERLVAAYGCRELIEMGAVDILQTDINHVGGISALWKVAAMANISNISMAPHACEGPIGGLSTLARGFRDAQFPGSGNLQLREARRKREDLGGMVWVSRNAHGGWPGSPAHKTGLGF